MSLPHTPKYTTTSQYWLGSSKGSFERVFPELFRSDRDQGAKWGVECGFFCMCPTRWPPAPSQLLSGTMMPICHFGVLGQCLQLHSPRSRWSSHPFLPCSPHCPPPGPTQSKDLSKSQHRLPTPSPSRVERVLGCQGGLPNLPQPSRRDRGMQPGWESGGQTD